MPAVSALPDCGGLTEAFEPLATSVGLCYFGYLAVVLHGLPMSKMRNSVLGRHSRGESAAVRTFAFRGFWAQIATVR